MVVLITILLCLFPAFMVLYPLIKRSSSTAPAPEDESSLRADLERRWESAIDGLRGTELERSVGNLDDHDYEWLKEVHMREAALVLKTLELSESEEALLMERINGELAKTRLGPEGPEAQSDVFSEKESFS